MFGALLSVFLLLMIGAAALTLVCSDLRRWNLPAKIGLSFGFGLLILAVTLFIASLCGAKPTPVTGLIEAILLLGIVVAVRRDNLAAWLPNKSEQDVRETLWLRALAGVLFVFVMGILVVVSAVSLLEPIVEWDVIAIWGLKAKVLLHEPVITSHYFSDLP